MNPSSAGAVGVLSEEANLLKYAEDVVEMLKLLNYEKDFCSKEKPPVHPASLALASNPGTQLAYFQELVAWLVEQLIGRRPTISAFEDPNSTAAVLSDAIKEANVDVDACPSRMTQGYGESILQILTALLKLVLQRRQFRFSAPEIPKPEDGVDDGTASLLGDDTAAVSEEEFLPEGENDDEQEALYVDIVKLPKTQSNRTENINSKSTVVNSGSDRLHNNDIITYPQDDRSSQSSWGKELERVSGRLKVAMPHDPKEWRSHLEQTVTYRNILSAHLPQTITHLLHLSQELSENLELTRKREGELNKQFEYLTAEHQEVQNKLLNAQSKYERLNDQVTNEQTESSRLAEEEESIKVKMEERCSQVSDTKPLAQAKDAMKVLQAEIRTMELKIGIVNQTLLKIRVSQCKWSRRHSYCTTGDVDATPPEELSDDEED